MEKRTIWRAEPGKEVSMRAWVGDEALAAVNFYRETGGTFQPVAAGADGEVTYKFTPTDPDTVFQVKVVPTDVGNANPNVFLELSQDGEVIRATDFFGDPANGAEPPYSEVDLGPADDGDVSICDFGVRI